MRLFEKESSQFPGTGSRSWAIHLQTFTELAETHEARNPETLLQLVRWTLGPEPKMVWGGFKLKPDHTGNGFLRLMESKYSSEITYARISSCLNSVSLVEELRSKDHGQPSTQHSRAATRSVNAILKLTKNLPESERTDTFLLQYLYMAVQHFEFAKTAQSTSLADKNTTFGKLNLSILTVAQLEDIFKPKTRRSDFYFAEEECNNDTDSKERVRILS